MTKEETIRQNMCHAADTFEWLTGETPPYVYISPTDMVEYVTGLEVTERIPFELRRVNKPLSFKYGETTIEIRANPFLLNNTAVCPW